VPTSEAESRRPQSTRVVSIVLFQATGGWSLYVVNQHLVRGKKHWGSQWSLASAGYGPQASVEDALACLQNYALSHPGLLD